MCSLTVPRSFLSTWDGSVSSSSMFGPLSSGPNAHIDRDASKSHWYFSWKNLPRSFAVMRMFTRPVSMSSAIPRSSGSAIIVRRFLWKAKSVFRLIQGHITRNTLLIRCIGVALERARLKYRLREFRDWIRYFDLDFRE